MINNYTHFPMLCEQCFSNIKECDSPHTIVQLSMCLYKISACNLVNLITLNILWETPLSVHTKNYGCAFTIYPVVGPQNVPHLFNCMTHPIDLSPVNLWPKQVKAIQELRILIPGNLDYRWGWLKVTKMPFVEWCQHSGIRIIFLWSQSCFWPSWSSETHVRFWIDFGDCIDLVFFSIKMGSKLYTHNYNLLVIITYIYLYIIVFYLFIYYRNVSEWVKSK